MGLKRVADSATNLNIRVTEFNPTLAELTTTKFSNKHGATGIARILDYPFIHDSGDKEWFKYSPNAIGSTDRTKRQVAFGNVERAKCKRNYIINSVITELAVS